MNRKVVSILALLMLAFVLMVSAGCSSSGNTGSTGDGTTGQGGTTGDSEPGSAGTNVTIDNSTYSPPSVEIAVGESVTWTNEEASTHTVTGDAGIDSGSLAKGESYTYTFDTAGTFGYHCSIHPYMTGSVTVK